MYICMNIIEHLLAFIEEYKRPYKWVDSLDLTSHVSCSSGKATSALSVPPSSSAACPLAFQALSDHLKKPNKEETKRVVLDLTPDPPWLQNEHDQTCCNFKSKELLATYWKKFAKNISKLLFYIPLDFC